MENDRPRFDPAIGAYGYPGAAPHAAPHRAYRPPAPRGADERARGQTYPSPVFGREGVRCEDERPAGPRFHHHTPNDEGGALIAIPFAFGTIFFVGTGAWGVAIFFALVALVLGAGALIDTSRSIEVTRCLIVAGYGRTKWRYRLGDVTSVERRIDRNEGVVTFRARTWDGRTHHLAVLPGDVAERFSEALRAWGVRVERLGA